ncbi:MAG TPA: hypothetical protein VF069_25010 [Streptosporangiaceae bacterium]
MTQRVPIDLPGSVTAHFVVAVPEPAAFSAELVRAPLPPPSAAGGPAATARRLHAASRLVVGGGPAATSGWAGRLSAVAGPGDATASLPAATHHIVVTSTGPPATGPHEAMAARFLARSLAGRTGGVVVDVTANQALSRAGPAGAVPAADGGAFALGDEWLAVFVRYHEEVSAAGLVRVETAGLRRFALPELAMPHVPLGRMLTAVNIVRALAHRLLHDHWAWLAAHREEPVRWVDREHYAAARDVWRYWGARPVGGGGVWVRLSAGVGPAPDRVAWLEITPCTARPRDDWWAEEAAPVIPLLTSAPAAPPRVPRHRPTCLG